MKITGNYLLPCTPEQAWDALNDPEILQSSLKGCEKLEKTSQTDFTGTVSTRIGPVSARFNGKMKQTEVNPPHGCVMNFEGQGGVAGHAKGNAKVTLDAEDGGTRLSYVADAQIGGKLAQMGARLVEGAAKTLADDFFARFSATLGAEPATAASEPDSQPADVAMAPSGKLKWVIIGLAILAAVAGYVFLS
jgi:uncharacterized protein